MQTAILAGGLGTRLLPLTRVMPKSLVPVRGKPFLQHQIELLRDGGIKDIVMLVGHHADVIREHFGDGTTLGVRIRYSDEGELRLGTAGAVKYAEALLDQSFFLLFGDSYLPIDYAAIDRSFREGRDLGLMTVFRNHNRFDTSDVMVEGDRVVSYRKDPPLPDACFINYGLMALRKQVLQRVADRQPLSLQSFLEPIIAARQLAAYEVWTRFYEIGSFEGLKDLEDYLGGRGVDR